MDASRFTSASARVARAWLLIRPAIAFIDGLFATQTDGAYPAAVTAIASLPRTIATFADVGLKVWIVVLRVVAHRSSINTARAGEQRRASHA